MRTAERISGETEGGTAMLHMMKEGRYNCPVKNCTAAYRGSKCDANRAKMGEDTDSLTRGDYVRTMSDEELAAWLLRSQNSWLMFFAENAGMEKEITPSDDASDILAWLREPYLEGGK
jgi:hypothetical protein